MRRNGKRLEDEVEDDKVDEFVVVVVVVVVVVDVVVGVDGGVDDVVVVDDDEFDVKDIFGAVVVESIVSTIV